MPESFSLEFQPDQNAEPAAAWQYQRNPEGKDEWLTPPDIIKALGEFDLDPCAPINRPWSTATDHFTILDNGLLKPWFGRVWCNPPYGSQTGQWLGRLREHGNGIALVFARTETAMFFEHVWPFALAVFFFRGRITFLNVDGSKPKYTGGAPSCLVAFNSENVESIVRAQNSGALNGHLVFCQLPNQQNHL